MIELILFLFALALIMEIIDSGLGMGYGTVLSPLLIILGFGSLSIVPCILASQALGGLLASIFHNRFKNAELGYCKTKPVSTDLKIVAVITCLGVLATIFAVFVAVSIPKWALNGYIGIVVLAMGIVLLSKAAFKFSWKKMLSVGILASFNKGLSGGGFGPVATGGQLISGQKNKNAIGCTTLAEVPICITGFLVYVWLKGIPDLSLLLPLLAGAIVAAPIGALVTKRIDSNKLRFLLGLTITVLGIWTIVKVVM